MCDYDVGEFLRIAEHRLRDEFGKPFGWGEQDMRGFETLNRFFLGFLAEMHNFTK
jgi:hypothetical protein